MISQFRNWVFDLDGTLIDSHSNYFQTVKRVVNRRGVELSEEAAYLSLGMNRRDFLLRHFSEQDLGEVTREIQEASERDILEIQMFPGIRKSLEFLRESRARLALWTLRDLKSAKIILENTGLDSFFEICVSGSCVNNPKPHPEGINKIIQSWGSDLDSTVMVGDHDVDVQGARAAGVSVAKVSWAYSSPKKCDLANYQFYSVDRFDLWLRSDGTLNPDRRERDDAEARRL